MAHLRRRQGVGHVDRRVGTPLDDVDALVAQLLDHHADAGALRPHAGAHRIQVRLAGEHGHLGTGAGLAGHGLDLHDPLVNLRHLDLEETADEVGVGAGDDDGRTRLLAAGAGRVGVGVAHLDDEHLQALVVAVVLVGRALVALARVALGVVMGQLRLDALADLDDGEVRRALQHGARDQIAHAAAELVVDGLTPGLTHERRDDALGVLGGDAAHVVGSDVALLELAVLAGLLVGLAHGHELVDVDLAGLAVDGHARVPFQIEDALVALRQGLLQALDEVELVDLALVGQCLQGLDQF